MASTRKIVTISMLLLPSCWAFADDGHQWTLKECIDYAVKHNITVVEGRLLNGRQSADDLRAWAESLGL